MARSDNLLRTVSLLVLAAAISAPCAYADDIAKAPNTDPAKPVLSVADPFANDVAPADDADVLSVNVTAERRTEKAQDVPASLHVLTGSDLDQDDQIQRANDVTQFLPNANAAPPDGVVRPRWFIRGLGTNNTGANTNNPVGVYYDDVYIGNVQDQALPLFDEEHVEMLEGPQGTLWGKNANSGAFNFISKKPTFDPEGYAEVGYGSFVSSKEEAVLNGPLIDNEVAGRLSIYNYDTQGWQKNLYLNDHDGGYGDVAVRGQLLFTPTNDLNILVSGHIRSFDGTDGQFGYVEDPVLNPVGTVQLANYAKLLKAYPDGYPILPYGDSSLYTNGADKEHENGGMVKATWDLHSAVITSITGYEAFDRLQLGSGTAAPAFPVNSPDYGIQPSYTRTTSSYDQVSEELRAASPTSQAFTWQAGLFAYAEHLDYDTATDYSVPSLAPNANTVWARNPYQQDKQSYSAFASLGYAFTDSLKFNSGLRWTDEDQKISMQYYQAPTTLNPANFWEQTVGNDYDGHEDRSFQAWTYDATPEYKITEDVLSYFRYAHGVLPGGYTVTAYNHLTSSPTSLSAVQISNLNPETLDDYELGLKTQWFNHRLTVNGSVFDYQYQNAIVNVPTLVNGTTSVLFRNAGAAWIRGAELQIDAVPIPDWHIGGNIGLLNTRYTSQIGSVNEGIVGAQFPRSPNQTVNAYTSYRLDLPWGGDSVWAADINWRSHQWLYPTTCTQLGTNCTSGTGVDQTQAVQPYAITNLHVTWHPYENKKLAIELSALNVADTKYYIHGLSTNYGYALQDPGQPQSFFVTVSRKF